MKYGIARYGKWLVGAVVVYLALGLGIRMLWGLGNLAILGGLIFVLYEVIQGKTWAKILLAFVVLVKVIGLVMGLFFSRAFLIHTYWGVPMGWHFSSGLQLILCIAIIIGLFNSKTLWRFFYKR